VPKWRSRRDTVEGESDRDNAGTAEPKPAK
jgi:hypothetical protein